MYMEFDLLSDFTGNIFSANLPRYKVISHSCSDVHSVSIGAANEGAASVFPIRLCRLSIDTTDNIITSLCFYSDCKVYALGLSPAADLISCDETYLLPGLRKLISISSIAPELNDDEIETLAQNITRSMFEMPDCQHIFVAYTQEAEEVATSSELLDVLVKKCINASNAVIYNIADYR